MQTERFQVRKSPSTKNPWLVEDTHSDPAEDAVLYHFPSKKKAEAFKSMMDAEHGNKEKTA
jgi:hypothetical protein